MEWSTPPHPMHDCLLTRCKNVDEVREEAKKILLLKTMGKEESAANHFFFMDAKGSKVVLEPKTVNSSLTKTPKKVISMSIK